MARQAACGRAPARGLLGLALVAVLGLRLRGVAFRGLAPSFVAPASGLRGVDGRSAAAVTARRAEGEKKKDDGGFLKFLKVEQDIELSPEEYAMALRQEMESQRKRFYINGEVKPNNLIVPWKPVEEKSLEKEARRSLKKNGIADPSGADRAEEEEDSEIEISLIGEQDVRIDWAGGTPGTKVGYIVERKPTSSSNFEEVATYEDMGTSFLLAKEYAGHEYSYADEIVKPGQWTYRILCRYRSGEITVVDQKDITVPQLSGVDNGLALIAFAVFAVVSLVGTYLADTGPTA